MYLQTQQCLVLAAAAILQVLFLRLFQTLSIVFLNFISRKSAATKISVISIFEGLSQSVARCAKLSVIHFFLIHSKRYSLRIVQLPDNIVAAYRLPLTACREFPYITFGNTLFYGDTGRQAVSDKQTGKFHKNEDQREIRINPPRLTEPKRMRIRKESAYRHERRRKK